MFDIKNSSVPIPNFDLTGKVAIVTGSTEGIGYGIAMVLAAYGASVVISSRRKEKCEEVAKEIVDLGGVATAIPCNVTVKPDIDVLVEKTVERFGRVDIMVNNSGTGVTKRITDMTEEDWDIVVDTNLKSVFFGMAATAKIMIAQGIQGRIINIASAGGLVGTKNIAAYCASKAGVISLSKSGAMEFGKFGITVNSVCPGYVPTNINKGALEIEKVKSQILNRTALKRLGEIWEVAAVVLFLASDASSIMTGAYLAADMGTTCN